MDVKMDGKVCMEMGEAEVVGVEGFEPPTFSSRTRRATKLRYTPMGADSTRVLSPC